MRLFIFILLGGLLCSAPAAKTAGAESQPADAPRTNVLNTLYKEHPRLLAKSGDFERLKQTVGNDALLKKWHGTLSGHAASIIEQAPSRYEIPDGLRLLSTSRRVLDRVYTLALAFRLDGQRRYVDRAWKELAAAAEFKDWNPRHFLDSAEMTHAFAIGYDWLYDAWTKEQRDSLRRAMIEKGLKPALESYRGASTYGWWTKSRFNWNQVCNGGIGMGALAIGDEEPALAEEILQGALKSLPLAMAEFAPDGAWAEGPGYWDYATSYNVVILAALETALGTDFGLSKMQGFADTGLFPIYLMGPLDRTFNYADGSDHAIRAPQMLWLARKFNQSAYAGYQSRLASAEALDLLWLQTPGSTASSPEALSRIPLDRYFRNAEVVTMRSGWNDRDAIFIGFKAGDNKANHSNLDLGTFVLDALGCRWAVDLGADNYNLPAYFGNKRWTYYRMRAEGHNVLIVNPGTEPDQDPTAAARITHVQSRPDSAFALADLTPAIARHARKFERGIALVGRKQVLVQDEVRANQPVQAWWFMHTPAQIEVGGDGASAVLSQSGKTMTARILAPPGAKFEVMDARPLTTSPNPDGQNQNQGIRKLAVHLENVTDLRLAVLLTPTTVGDSPKVKPFVEW